MASGGVRTRGRDSGDGPAVPCCALCSPLADMGDVAVAVHCHHHGFGQGALSSSLLSSLLSLSLSLSSSLESPTYSRWNPPESG